MPFRASAPFLHEGYWCRIIDLTSYQCPFGLGLHFYFWDSLLMVFIALNVSMPFRAGASFLRKWISIMKLQNSLCINALSGWGFISTVPLQKPRFYAVSGACFCRYLSEYSDNGHFPCMLTIWTYLIATSTTLAFFSITLFLQFVIRYFYIFPTSSDLKLQLALSTIKFKVLSCAYNHALF